MSFEEHEVPQTDWHSPPFVGARPRRSVVEFGVYGHPLVHVYPIFGRTHLVSLECWCHPHIDRHGLIEHMVDN